MSALAYLDPKRPAPAPALADLLALAQSRTSDDRQRLLLGITALCDARPPSGELSPVLSEIFLLLAQQAERDVRRILSERLAHAEWAPRALVNVLALDEIEIARPIIAASPLLQDEDLLAILVQATIEHQIEVARRPRLSGRVADAIIERAEPASLTALASNRTAEISGEGLRRMVDHSRRIAALRAPLTRHPRLSDMQARQLYQWVGAALRQSIAERFTIDEQALQAEIDKAVDGAWRDAQPPAVAGPDPEREEMERRLIDKMQAAGQLKPGFLIRAIRESRLSLFTQALATLGGYSLGQVREALAARTPETLYYACASIGIDRAVFPALLADVRRLNGGPPGDAGAAVWLRGDISAASAARAFRALVQADTPGTV
ncbi:DUF2336 domain-containing protein [Brevundimonas sp.]|uniref:DUF2336 domain-containing protein n=1 Tax=Brevundimonas sp. TaxID=1871086 RepID=UPI002ABBEFA5|nr:DUF2336 domain-containing protein [Brevundimonas sp.]MDZ4362809.1 DUF2336 domain-containing protein [Brevundimonas sp.]